LERYPCPRDLGAWRYYVEHGDVFDVNDYCEAYGLPRSEVNHNDIANAQAAASNLGQGEWLGVSHWIEE